VQVSVRRDGTNTQSAATYFMNIFGRKEIGLNTTATAMIASTSAAEEMPMALRVPDFGSVDPKVTADNPGRCLLRDEWVLEVIS
jgi:hypothetical protein